jgi:iron complex transport system substrate-binding protein
MMCHVFFLACCIGLPVASFAAISVQDDSGHQVVLQQPARRIVTLAPHATELVFAAGGGAYMVGTVSHSDYPPAARSITRIGDNNLIDMERMIAQKPDLLVVWRHNTSSRELESLRKLGIPLFYSEPRILDDIPSTLLRLGRLMGTETQARYSADALHLKLADLAARYRARPTVRVFYQVWDHPLYTLNGSSIVSDALRLCGGENIFAGLTAVAPMVGIESVLKENPEAVVSGETTMHTMQAVSGLAHWKQYPALLAVQRGNLFAIDADLLNRAGPRLVDGAAQLCEKLEQARKRR